MTIKEREKFNRYLVDRYDQCYPRVKRSESRNIPIGKEISYKYTCYPLYFDSDNYARFLVNENNFDFINYMTDDEWEYHNFEI